MHSDVRSLGLEFSASVQKIDEMSLLPRSGLSSNHSHQQQQPHTLCAITQRRLVTVEEVLHTLRIILQAVLK